MGAFSFGGDVLLSALFEDKPSVPDYARVDLPAIQKETAAGNLGILPESIELGEGINQYMRGEREKTLSGIPGLADLEGKTAANLSNWASGNLGDDWTNNILRGVNAKGFASGAGSMGGPGSFTGNWAARDLGLSGLDIAMKAAPMTTDYLSGAYGRRAIPEYDPSFMMMSPQFAAGLQSQENQAMFNRDWLANRVKAQPEPWQQTLMGSVDEASSLFGSAASSAGGAAAGAAAGGGGMSY